MVSKVCHSHESSSTLASAAHMPPWAAPVCERVGYSLVRTAVWHFPAVSMAARSPAPPAPTTTASYVCRCTFISLSLLLPNGRVVPVGDGRLTRHLELELERPGRVRHHRLHGADAYAIVLRHLTLPRPAVGSAGPRQLGVDLTPNRLAEVVDHMDVEGERFARLVLLVRTVGHDDHRTA